MPIRVLRVELREQEQVPVAHILLSPGQLGARSGQHRLTAELSRTVCAALPRTGGARLPTHSRIHTPDEPGARGHAPMSGHKPCSPLSKMFSWNFTSSSRMSRVLSSRHPIGAQVPGFLSTPFGQDLPLGFPFFLCGFISCRSGCRSGDQSCARRGEPVATRSTRSATIPCARSSCALSLTRRRATTFNTGSVSGPGCTTGRSLLRRAQDERSREALGR